MSNSSHNFDLKHMEHRRMNYTFQHNMETICFKLEDAKKNSRFGDGPAEKDPAELSTLEILLTSFPRKMILLEGIWTSLVIVLHFFVSEKENGFDILQTLQRTFWQSRFHVNPWVTASVGWALFTLLAFYLKESSDRYHNALQGLTYISYLLRKTGRQFIQAFPDGTWHVGDRDRIFSYLIAFPILLKMQLRNEKKESLLEDILPKADVEEILKRSEMHVHCIRTLQSYLRQVEDDSPTTFKATVDKSPGSRYMRNILGKVIDSLENEAIKLLRIREFPPALGYISHLKASMYLWFLLVPLSLIEKTGWFAIIWTLAIVYGVGMTFIIANQLNDPFGYDLQDIKLNKFAAETSHEILKLYQSTELELPKVIRSNESSNWLRKKLAPQSIPKKETKTKRYLKTILFPVLWPYKTLKARIVGSKFMQKYLLFYTLWVVISLIATWAFSKLHFFNSEKQKCRWWCVYLLPDPFTTGNFSLPLFLLLVFWINDAYGRYWGALHLWTADLPDSLGKIATHFSLSCSPGIWHFNDLQRIYSHIVAIPYVLKSYLRDSKEYVDLGDMLSPEDLCLLKNSVQPELHCLDVLYGYINSASCLDKCTFGGTANPFQETAFVLQDALLGAEKVFILSECIRFAPLSPSITFHLRTFIGIFLSILPLSMIEHDGVLVPLYSIFIGYSVLNIYTLGEELSDPFGTDPGDLPLESFCANISEKVRDIYHSCILGPRSLVKTENYNRVSFLPRTNFEAELLSPLAVGDENSDNDIELAASKKYSVVSGKLQMFSRIRKDFFQAFHELFPPIPIKFLISCTIWAIFSTLASYGLSFLWDDERCLRKSWRCSPIHVDSDVLNYTGFALFLILGFRVRGSFERYEDGAKILIDIQKQLRCLAIEIVLSFPPGTWHEKDIERLIAHIIQIAIEIKELLSPNCDQWNYRNGLLSENDTSTVSNSNDKVLHCMMLVKSYLLSAESPTRDKRTVKSDAFISAKIIKHLLRRTACIQLLVARAETIKKYRNAKSFTKHQRLFTFIWLFLLPLGMVATSGLFTIFLTPIISYAVLSLDSLADRLVDPYRKGYHKLSVEDFCDRTISDIIDAVNSVNWDFKYHVAEMKGDFNKNIRIRLRGKDVENEWSLVHFSNQATTNLKSTKNEIISHPKRETAKLSMKNHLIQSTPWKTLFLVSIWTVVCALVSQELNPQLKENPTIWESSLTVSKEFAIYFGFATFLTLSIYVETAFLRHRMAGTIWEEDLRRICHSLSIQWLQLFPGGRWHKYDHERVLAHILSVPVCLKNELRGQRNIRELKGVLSQQDVGRIHNSESMSTHCLDVIRSYFITGISHLHHLDHDGISGLGPRKGSFRREFLELERAVQNSLFIKNTQIAPAGVLLLKLELRIWIAFLPLILVQVTGWFALVIMPIITFGIIGLYRVANDIKMPFGENLNCIDLDEKTEEIVKDICCIHRANDSVLQICSSQLDIGFDFHHRVGLEEFRKVHENEISNKVQFEQTHASNPSEGSVSRTVQIPVSSKRKILKCLNSILNNPFQPLIKLALSEHKIDIGNIPLHETFRISIHGMSLRPFLAIILWTTFLVAIGRLFSTPSETLNDPECGKWWCSAISFDARLHKAAGFAVFLLLSRRLGDSHIRYVEGVIVWREKFSMLCEVLSFRLISSCNQGIWHSGDVERIIGHLIAFVMITSYELQKKSKPGTKQKLEINDNSLECKLKALLGEADSRKLFVSERRRDHCLDEILKYIVLLEHSDEQRKCPQNELKFITFYIHELRKLSAYCKTIQRVKMPFGYLQHLKIFMWLWMALLPLVLLESSGWISLLWVTLICHGIIGSERWSRELCDPFGNKVLDIPLSGLQNKIVSSILQNYLNLVLQRGMKREEETNLISDVWESSLKQIYPEASP